MAKKFVCSTTEPVVSTKAGKVRGFCVTAPTPSTASNMPMRTVSRCPGPWSPGTA